MAKYYYNRYTIAYYSYYTDPSFIFAGDTTFPLGTQAASGYSFNLNSGYSLTGYIFMEGNTTYTGSATTLYQCVYYGKDSTNVFVHAYLKAGSRIDSNSQGYLVTSNVIAEDGTYPANGQFGDGYWYVRQGLAPSFFFMNF